VDSTFDSGWSSSLALDSNDTVHISYYQGWKIGDLRHVTSADNSTYFPKPAAIWLPPSTNSTNSSSGALNETMQNDRDETSNNKTQTEGKTTMNELPSDLQSINTDPRDGLENSGSSEDNTSTMEKQETFPTALVLTASGAPVVAFSTCMLVYFKKRQKAGNKA
jgi:hypothetical protein